MTRRSLLLVPLGSLVPRRQSDDLPAPPATTPLTRIVLGGDVMLSRYVGRLARQKQDAAWPFRELAGFFSRADIGFCNLESPFSERGPATEYGMVFRSEPRMIEGLLLAGIDVVSTANNHARDAGEHGLTFTLEWLARNGILAVGTGATGAAAHEGVVIERNGTRFGFLAYTYDQLNGNRTDLDERVAMLDLERMRAGVAQMLGRAEVIVVSMHAGVEYQREPNEQQRRFARAAIDAGAAIVAGHHPHVVQPVERYAGGVIFYSLGNLVFDQFQRRATQQGLLAEVTFAGRKLVDWQALPVEIRQTVPRLAAR